MFLYNGPSISRVNTIRITFVVWVNWTTVTIFYTFILYRQTQLALSVQMYFSPYVSYFFFFVLFCSRAFHFSITDFIYIHWLLTLVIIFFSPPKKKYHRTFIFLHFATWPFDALDHSLFELMENISESINWN